MKTTRSGMTVGKQLWNDLSCDEQLEIQYEISMDIVPMRTYENLFPGFNKNIAVDRECRPRYSL